MRVLPRTAPVATPPPNAAPAVRVLETPAPAGNVQHIVPVQPAGGGLHPEDEGPLQYEREGASPEDLLAAAGGWQAWRAMASATKLQMALQMAQRIYQGVNRGQQQNIARILISRTDTLAEQQAAYWHAKHGTPATEQAITKASLKASSMQKPAGAVGTNEAQWLQRMGTTPAQWLTLSPLQMRDSVIAVLTQSGAVFDAPFVETVSAAISAYAEALPQSAAPRPAGDTAPGSTPQPAAGFPWGYVFGAFAVGFAGTYAYKKYVRKNPTEEQRAPAAYAQRWYPRAA